MSTPLLNVVNLHHRYPTSEREVLRGLSLHVDAGESLALVGASGCGKTTLGRCIVQLERPTAGDIVFDGIRLGVEGAGKQRDFRRRIQLIPQNAGAALNPRMSIAQCLREPFQAQPLLQQKRPRPSLDEAVQRLLELVDLDEKVLPLRPQQLSGGMQQRVVIARALSVEPKLIVADEPTSNIDVALQAQIVELLASLQKQLGLACLFITHDLNLVPHISQRVAIMQAGRIVETMASEALFRGATHAHTLELIAATPASLGRHSRRMDRRPRTESSLT